MIGKRLKRVVVLANGTFPRKNVEAWRQLNAADVVVACDGAAGTLWRRLGRKADYVVGDFDSLPRLPKLRGNTEYVHLAEQETNDLGKALAFCRARGWRRPVVVGASGKREDHLLGNVFRAMEAGVELLTDEGAFLPAQEKGGQWRLRVATCRGQAFSVFCTDAAVTMRSTGLEWPLAGVRLRTLYAGTLNRATGAAVTLVADRPFFVFCSSAPAGGRQ